MRIPYFIKGAIFAPAVVLLSVVLKISCPAPVGEGCFTDFLAVPVFLPLALVYKFSGTTFPSMYEFWFVVVLWAVIGMVIGFIADLYKRQSQYSHGQYPPPSQTSAPESLPPSQASRF